MKTYYQILGLEPDCETNAVKKAFRRLALRYHPDYNAAPTAAMVFQEIREAYEVLSDEDLREEYDVFLVENSPEFEYVQVADTNSNYAAADSSDEHNFAEEAEPEPTPFMFLLWVLAPLVVAGMAIEFLDSPVLAAISVPVVIGFLLWIRYEIKSH
ncbi:MAG TPA: J domain-containing protein [Bacteroidetes bacterium]|nr:J domain-containing protein [Bacteroidota bacterium]